MHNYNMKINTLFGTTMLAQCISKVYIGNYFRMHSSMGYMPDCSITSSSHGIGYSAHVTTLPGVTYYRLPVVMQLHRKRGSSIVIRHFTSIRGQGKSYNSFHVILFSRDRNKCMIYWFLHLVLRYFALFKWFQSLISAISENWNTP